MLLLGESLAQLVGFSWIHSDSWGSVDQVRLFASGTPKLQLFSVRMGGLVPSVGSGPCRDMQGPTPASPKRLSG